MDRYEEIYRRLNPKTNPYGRERQAKLSDLWPCDQEKFKRDVDLILNHHTPKQDD